MSIMIRYKNEITDENEIFQFDFQHDESEVWEFLKNNKLVDNPIELVLNVLREFSGWRMSFEHYCVEDDEEVDIDGYPDTIYFDGKKWITGESEED